MSSAVNESGNPKAITSSTLVKTGGCIVLGVFCSSALTSSRVAISDGTASAASAAAGRIVAPFQPTAGTFHRLAVGCGTGCFVSLSGSAQAVTVVYAPSN